MLIRWWWRSRLGSRDVLVRDREERRRWEEYERQLELELEGLEEGVDEGAGVLGWLWRRPTRQTNYHTDEER
jgi:hypothetical protein